MPIYEYRCSCTVRELTERKDFGDTRCGMCQGKIRRVFRFSFIRPMQAAYNPSVGKHVSNMAQLKSEFSRMSDEAEMYTGNPHKFVPTDPMDKKALGVTDEGLASTHDQLLREGKKDAARRLLKP